MTAAPQYVTHRATMEDLPQLMALWRLEQLPAEELEKRFTEFQVVSGNEGKILAALGVQISGPHGLLHSESIAQPEMADRLRELLWKRLQVMIQNHALERLWTQVNVPFWRDKDFGPATAEQLAAMPAHFKQDERPWHTKTLRAAVATATFEREFADLRQLQHQEAQRMKERVQWMKRIAWGVFAITFILVIICVLAMIKVKSGMPPGR